jgi:hypothetical protein
MGLASVSSFTPDEVRALDKVLSRVLAASKATPPIMDDVAFIQSGWPIKIRDVARPAGSARGSSKTNPSAG